MNYYSCPFVFQLNLPGGKKGLIQMFKEKIVQGGATLAVQIAPNRILHYFGKSIEITDNKMQVKQIFQRIGGFRNE